MLCAEKYSEDGIVVSLKKSINFGRNAYIKYSCERLMSRLVRFADEYATVGYLDPILPDRPSLRTSTGVLRRFRLTT